MATNSQRCPVNLLERQEAYWNSVSGKKEFPLPLQLGLFSRHVAREAPILDVGCGYGRTLDELHQNGYTNLAGVDFAQGMIDRGLRMHPHLNLAKIQHGALPFEDGTFSAVILIAVLTCIAPTAEQLRLVAEIERVLQEDGVLYVNDYLLNDDQRNLDRYERSQHKYGTYGIFEIPEGAVVRHHTRQHIAHLTGRFREIVFQPVVYTTMNGNRSNGFYYLGQKTA